MNIGELARLAGVSSHTIRFYERTDLLRPPRRSAAGYRSYSREDLRELRKIRSLKRVGFTLEEILLLTRYEEILTSDRHPSEARSSAQSQILECARERLRSLSEQLHRLSRMKSELERLIDALANSSLGRDFALPSEVAVLSEHGEIGGQETGATGDFILEVRVPV